MTGQCQWPTRRLREIGTVVTGTTPPTAENGSYGGTIPFITPAHLDSEDPISTTPVGLTQSGAAKARLLAPNSVLVCCIGATIGKVGITDVPAITNQQINAVEFDPAHINPRFALHYFKSIKSKLKLLATSTTLPILNKSRFASLEIPVPRLSEQKRIAAILDKADAIRRKREQAIKLADEFLRSLFLDMFGDPATNPKRLPIVRIGDLLSSVAYGTSKKACEQGQYPVLRMLNITYEGSWKLSDFKFMDLTAAEFERYSVEKGDILFNRTNSRELVGKTAVFRSDGPMVYAGYLIRLRTNERAHPEYISAFLNSGYMKRQLRDRCKSIIGMANINAKEIQAFPVPLPAIHSQEAFATCVEAVLKSRTTLEGNLCEINRLVESLTQRAFRGEL